MGSLYDNVLDQEKKQEKKQKKEYAVNKILTTDGSKDKQISAKINSVTYAMFTEINKKQGLSNNSAINMLINRYIRENEDIIG